MFTTLQYQVLRLQCSKETNADVMCAVLTLLACSCVFPVCTEFKPSSGTSMHLMLPDIRCIISSNSTNKIVQGICQICELVAFFNDSPQL